MFRGGRRVKPQHEDTIDFSSDSSETISSLAYTFRKVRKSVISRTCDKDEIQFIERRFEDTSKVIFQELDQSNRSLLKKSYKQPFRSDVITVGGIRVGSPISEAMLLRPAQIRSEQVTHHQENTATPVLTFEEIWNESHNNKPAKAPHPIRTPSTNTVSPENLREQTRSKRSSSVKGLCRIA